MALLITQSDLDPLEQRGLSSSDRTGLGGRYQAEVSPCHPGLVVAQVQDISLLNSKTAGDSSLGSLSVQAISQTSPVQGTALGPFE